MTLTAAILATLGLTAADADQPGPAAVAYLDSLRDTRVAMEQPDAPSLEPTAVSRFVGREKRLQLIRQIELMAKGIDRDLPFEIEAERTDDDLAAVLVRQWQPDDPSGPRWFPLAMVRRDARWLPAPAPGSFENALYGYDRNLRRRAQALERWLMRERATRNVAMLDRQLAEMRERMSAKVAADLLSSGQPDKVVNRFLAACADREMDAALALLGGLHSKLPEDWPQIHQAVFAGLGKDSSHPLHAPWRLLCHPQAVRTLVAFIPSGADRVAHIACLDPGTGDSAVFGTELKPRVVILKLRLDHRDKPGWRIKLPEALLVPETAPADPRRIFHSNWFTKLASATDGRMAGRLPKTLHNHSPPQALPDHPALARKVAQKLESGNFPDLLRHFALGEDPDLSLLGHERAAELWVDARLKGNCAAILLLDQVFGEQSGAIVLHFFSAQDPEGSALRVLRTIKTRDGWMLAPALLDLGGSPDIEEDLLTGELILAAPRWEKEAPEKILEGAARIGGLPADRAPAIKQARAAVLAWHEAVLAGEVRKAVASSALFDNPRSTKRILRTLGHELVGARRNPQRGEIVAANQSGRWAAVSMRIKGGDKPSFPFYAVILSDDGPRVLPEIDLFHRGSRSRSFLNRAVWNRLGELLPETAVDELRALFDQHSDLIGDDEPPRATVVQPTEEEQPNQ